MREARSIKGAARPVAPRAPQAPRRRAPIRPPPPELCDICGEAKAHRRGTCWSCYRKFQQANLPLPLRLADRQGDPLVAWAHSLTKPQLRRVMAALRTALTPRSPTASTADAADELNLFSIFLKPGDAE